MTPKGGEGSAALSEALFWGRALRSTSAVWLDRNVTAGQAPYDLSSRPLKKNQPSQEHPHWTKQMSKAKAH